MASLPSLISNQISRSALEVVLKQLRAALATNPTGDIVELGCYIGTTSLFIRRTLDSTQASSRRQFHVYDSFEGLPPKTKPDENAAGIDFQAGELQVSKKQFLHEFQKAHLQPPITHKGWFDQLSDRDLPQQIAFAFLDGDFYESILTSLQLVWPHLSPQGVITIDDYQRETLPGVEHAVRDFFQGKAYRLCHEQNIAIITRA